MEHLYEKVLSWYLGLKWWWKVLGVGVIIVLILLFILKVFFTRGGTSGESALPPGGTTKTPPADAIIAKDTDKHIAALQTADAAYAEQLHIMQADIMLKHIQAAKTDADRAVGMKKIRDAKSMDDLKRLERELGLVKP